MKPGNALAIKEWQDVRDAIPCYLFSFSQEGIITYANYQFLLHLGYDRGELVHSKKFNDILTVGSRIFFETHFYPLIRLHGEFDELFLSFNTADGKELPVLMNVKQIGREKDFVIHCAGVRITQRNRYEKEIIDARNAAEKALLENEALNHYRGQLETNLENLEKRLQDITNKNQQHQQINTIISHDLQEPLRKVSIFSGRIISEKSEEIDPEVLNDLMKIDAASKKMRNLVINLQHFLSLNEKHVRKEKVDLELVITDVIQQLNLDKEPMVNLRVRALPVMMADRELMIHLFSHLVENSLKFRDWSKPSLEIEINSDIIDQNFFRELDYKYNYREYVRLVYSDNGVGFPESFATQAFTLFRKGHDKYEGVGIGLAYCKRIMELHEGIISVNSKEGEGTTFVLLFPNFI